MILTYGKQTLAEFREVESLEMLLNLTKQELQKHGIPNGEICLKPQFSYDYQMLSLSEVFKWNPSDSSLIQKQKSLF